MDISSHVAGRALVFAVNGRIDSLTAPQLGQFVDAQIAAGQHRLVADLALLSYTSSAGLRVLLGALKETRLHGGDLRLAAVPSGVGKVLEMSGFGQIFKSYATVEAATDSFGAPAAA